MFKNIINGHFIVGIFPYIGFIYGRYLKWLLVSATQLQVTGLSLLVKIEEKTWRAFCHAAAFFQLLMAQV